MLYNEFIEGTNCKDNEYNYKVYKDLEIMYMNSNMSKQDIYEYGKKLVDNSKSEKQIRFENEIKSQIADHKQEIANYKKQIKTEQALGNNRNYIKYCKEMINYHKRKINELKWIISN